MFPKTWEVGVEISHLGLNTQSLIFNILASLLQKKSFSDQDWEKLGSMGIKINIDDNLTKITIEENISSKFYTWVYDQDYKTRHETASCEVGLNYYYSITVVPLLYGGSLLVSVIDFSMSFSQIMWYLQQHGLTTYICCITKGNDNSQFF